MNRAVRVLDRLGLFAVILVFWAVFVVFANGFLTGITIFGLSRSIAITATIGLAQMVVLSIGQMNLAVGSHHADEGDTSCGNRQQLGRDREVRW